MAKDHRGGSAGEQLLFGRALPTYLGEEADGPGGLVLYIGDRMFAPEEEAALAKTFGIQWEEYRRRVKIPWA